MSSRWDQDSPAIPSNAVKSIKILNAAAAAGGEWEKRKGDNFRQRKWSAKERVAWWYESWKRGRGKPENFKHTLLIIKYSPESNQCDMWSWEPVCLTTTPAAWPTNLTTFSSLGASVGARSNPIPHCALKDPIWNTISQSQYALPLVHSVLKHFQTALVPLHLQQLLSEICWQLLCSAEWSWHRVCVPSQEMSQ